MQSLSAGEEELESVNDNGISLERNLFPPAGRGRDGLQHRILMPDKILFVPFIAYQYKKS